MKNIKVDFKIKKVLRDQDNGLWAEVTHVGNSGWISLEKFGEDESYGFRKLRRIGVHLLSSAAKSAAKNALQDVKPTGDIIVAKQPGYFFTGKGDEEELVCYVYGSGEIICSPGKETPEILAGFDLDEKFERRGDDGVFQKNMAVLVKDQAIPVLMLTLALVPILQPFAPAGMYVENFILEICGKSTTGKSAVAVGLAGAVWGGHAHSKTSFFGTWNATVNAIEEGLLGHHNALLGLDEATAISEEEKKRGQLIGHFAHRFSLGDLKQRMGDLKEQYYRLIAISTSNQSLASICKESPSVLEALETRLITLKVPDRSTYIFDQLPRGFKDFDKARLQFYEIGATITVILRAI